MKTKLLYSLLSALFLIIVFSNLVNAHCDGIDGPVVKSALKALDAKNINLVLIWIKKEYEPELKNHFEKTLKVRELNPHAKELADMYFFETVVRLHRLGEGAPYTGLKPAGTDLGPVIPAADKAIENNSVQQLSSMVTNDIQEKLQQSFKDVMEKKDFKTEEVEKGREFVAAYVTFMHLVEGIHNSIMATHHVVETEAGAEMHNH